jgi:hypothetical protein
MKTSLAVATTAAVLLLLLLLLVPAPARAYTIYPTSPCRVFVDTDYTQIAGQCGTVARWYPRKLFMQAPRKYYY